jgi:hypothetical protein
MTLTLGGPGVACSAMLVRRLRAGELSEEAARRAEAHLAGCARCQALVRELEAEAAALAAELPFEAFAGGVAERLAVRAAGEAPAERAAPRVRPAWRRAAPVALAAALALGVAAPLLSRLAGQGHWRPEDGTRVKGGAAAALWLREGDGARQLEAGEPIPAGGALRLALAPAGRRYAAAALRDEDGAVLLMAGPAAAGVGQAFEWTGRRGEVVVVYDDRPVDGAALVARLGRGGPAGAAGAGVEVGAGADVIVLPLGRGPR